MGLLTKKLRIQDKTSTLEKEGLKENFPEFLVLHSTYAYRNFNDLLDSHRNRGFAGAGYHIFVPNSNKVFQGRPYDLEGAHCLGFNTKSIGMGFYSDNGKPPEKVVNNAKKVISSIKEQYPNIKMISHTQGQLMYLNELLKKEGIEKQFPIFNYVVKPEFFDRIKEEVFLFTNSLDSSKYNVIKNQLKKLKNCPGEAYLNFI